MLLRASGIRNPAVRMSVVHIGAYHLSPHDAIEVTEVLRGIRRAWKRPAAQKTPAIDEEVKPKGAIPDRNVHGLTLGCITGGRPPRFPMLCPMT